MSARTIQFALALTSQLDAAVLWKATIVLAVCLATLPLMRRARSSVRHLLLAATFGTLLVLPFIIRTVPAITIRLPLDSIAYVHALSGVGTATMRTAVTSVDEARAPNALVDHLPLSRATVLQSMWAVGAVTLLIVLMLDLGRIRALRRGGLPWHEGRHLTRSVAIASGLRRPVEVLLHEGVSTPFTCGFWRPAILLPLDAPDWSEDDLRRALRHEFEHVKRGDWVTQLVARVVCACYWFHPFAWIAWGRLRLEAERACDDAVVQCEERTEYAQQLVRLARRLQASRTMPALGMANRSDLSARVGAILDGPTRPGEIGNMTMVVLVSVSAITMLSVAAVRDIAATRPSRLPPFPLVAVPSSGRTLLSVGTEPRISALNNSTRVRGEQRSKRGTKVRPLGVASVPRDSAAAVNQGLVDGEQALTPARDLEEGGSSLIPATLHLAAPSGTATANHSSSASASATRSASSSSSSNRPRR